MPKLPAKDLTSTLFRSFQGLPTVAAKPRYVDRSQLLHMLQQGVGLQRQSLFLEAERLYQAVLAQAPDMPEANNLLGTIAMEAKDYTAALEYFEKAVKGLPKDPFVRHNIASTLIALDDYHAAVPHLRRALQAKPGFVEAVAVLATCYNRMGRGTDALIFATKSLEMDERNLNGRIAYAEALINLGRMEEAEIFIQATISKGIAIPYSYQNLSSTRKFKADAPELQAIKQELSASHYTMEQRSHLYFAAAKICNDAKLYDEAMDYFQNAKAIAAQSYDVGRYEKRVDAYVDLFSQFFLGTRKDFGDQSRKPIFIVGMPRSGTTLVEQIISSHPRVAGGGELTKMSGIARSLGDNTKNAGRFTENLLKLTQEGSRALAGEYLKHLALISHDAERVTDKMPHNFEYVGLIALLFPNAAIIHCSRDPIDNCLSCYTNAFSEAHAYNSDLAKLGQYYRAHDRLMKHWHKVLPGRIFENRYETLIENQEEQSRKLIAHCGLEWDDVCLNYTQNERAVTTISRWQVRQPIYKTSMQRWRPYEKYLGPLITALGDLADVKPPSQTYPRTN